MSSQPTVRVALYARVSSEEQREGQTIDSQLAELERFASAQGWVVVGIYKDEGWSGAVLARPELDRLRDEASKQLFEIVLLNDVDRLARDVSHLGVLKRDLERHGVQVRFRKLPAEQSPTSNLMVNILGSFAEFEREMIIDRTRRGRRHKVEMRQQFLGSLPPYGYRYITKAQSASRDGYLERWPEQTTVVRQMFQWVDEEGLSTRQVVKRLNELRVLPPKGGRSWGKSSVTRILRCETYAGVWYFNKSESYAPTGGERREYRRSLKYKLRWRPREEWIRVQLPDALHIIARAQWERVQAQLTRNQSFSKRNAQHIYLLRGLVECGGCQARYVGDPNHGRFYYRCHRRCKAYPTVRAERLEELVWAALEEVLLHPEIVVEQVEQQERRKEATAVLSEKESREVEQGLQAVEEEERRVLEAYRIGVLTPTILGRELEQLRDRRTALSQRRNTLNTQSRSPSLPIIRRSVLAYCQETAQRLASLAEAERQRLLQLLIKKIIFRGDEIVIQGFIPPRNPSSAPEGESRSAQKQAPSSFVDGIADYEAYRRSRNLVIEKEAVRYELTRSFALSKPLFQEENLLLVRNLMEQNPSATLKQLCAMVQREKGFAVRISSMFRAQLRLGLRQKDRTGGLESKKVLL